jgi:hypothetical protein
MTMNRFARRSATYWAVAVPGTAHAGQRAPAAPIPAVDSRYSR